MKRVAIYARVSTTDKGQDLDTQLLPLKNYAQAREWTIHNIYTDTLSGVKEKRPGFDEMMQDATKRKFDVVLVFRFDRASRSTKQLLHTLETLRVLGIDFVSYSEAIDTSTPAGQMMFTMISAFAQFERSIIAERVKAGLHKAKKNGKKLGRPKITLAHDIQQKIYSLKQQGKSIRGIAKSLSLKKGQVEKVLSKKPC